MHCSNFATNNNQIIEPISPGWQSVFFSLKFFYVEYVDLHPKSRDGVMKVVFMYAFIWIQLLSYQEDSISEIRLGIAWKHR